MTRLPMLSVPPSNDAGRTTYDDSASSAARVAVVHLGCPKNLVDSEHMLASLTGAGMTLTGDASDADVLVINTCAFIGPAKEESVARILEGEQWKSERAGRRLVVAGCMAERHATELKTEIPSIDAFVGTGAVLDVAAAARGEAVALPGAKLPDWLPNALTPRILTTSTHTAYVKISEGCDHTCSFCIIPKLRGQHRSRPMDDIVAEVRSLGDMGVREINLVAQDSTSYGEDLGLRDGPAKLLRALGAVDTVDWIRVHYTYPTRLSDSFLDAMAETSNVCNYVDIPLQHANRDVLKAMRRGGDSDAYLALIERVRKRVPGVAIRTTFIVGFPNETERRFEELVDFVKTAALDRVGAFTYSHEEGTTAIEFRDRISEVEKERRRAKLMKLQARISGRRNRALIGQRRAVMVDAVDPDRQRAFARLEGQAPEIDGHVTIDTADVEPGDLLDVDIVDATAYDLSATLVPWDEQRA